jgi:hypothetical protein
MSQLEELHAAYVGQRVFAAMMQARAAALAAHNGSAGLTADGDDDVSVEVTVWGDSDEDSGGGGTDVLQLDPWMFQASIKITVPWNLPDPPQGPHGTDDPPDECKMGLAALDAMKSNLAADQSALNALETMLAQAGSHEEKKAIRGQIRQVKDSIAENQNQIASETANLKSEGCL